MEGGSGSAGGRRAAPGESWRSWRIGVQIRDEDRSQDMGFNIRIRIWELGNVGTGLGMDQGQ